MTPRTRYWRVLAPRWAHLPLSGDGAAAVGGRYNTPGTPALYLAADLETAVAEYEQSLLVRPGTFCAYDVGGGRIADLMRKPQLAGGVDPHCAWRTIWLERRERPPTWDLVDRLLEQGFHGARAPSAARTQGVNLVLWQWNQRGRPKVSALDPANDLPVDQRSWPTEHN